MKKTVSLIICICLIAGVFASCKGFGNSATVYDLISYTYDSAYTCDDATVRTYEDICEAVVHGEKTVRINAGLLDGALTLFYTSFPLSVLVENIQPGDGAYIIKYKYEDHTKKVDDFILKKYDIATHCNNENDAVFTINLYNYIASSIKPSSDSSISCYETMMTGEGTSFSYANMFEYILQQRRIKAYHILCEDASGSSKAITAAELDGKLYYFDIYAEYEENGGKLFRFFGMTSEDLQSLGYKNMIYTSRETAAISDDKRFEALRNMAKWELADNGLTITDKSGKLVQIAL